MGFLEFNGSENFFGRISGIDSGDDFEFVGSVDLNKDSANQNIVVKPAKQNKKTPSLNENVVKVISGATTIATTSTASSTSSISIVENNIIQISSTSIQEQKVVASTTFIAPIIQPVAPVVQPSIANHILVSEIMVGIDGNANYEFIEIFNPTANPIDLTGWSIKKKSSTNSESTFVSSSRLEGKIISPNKYFLLVNEGGYGSTSSPQADIFWPKSYTLAYSNNAIIIYNANSELIEEVSWTEIPKGQSIER